MKKKAFWDTKNPKKTSKKLTPTVSVTLPVDTLLAAAQALAAAAVSV